MRWTDHKTVGLQYGLTALFFLLVGFLLMILMRWQLAWPGQPMPGWMAAGLGEANAPGGVMLPEFYNQLVAMHGTVMVFLAVVPLAAGAFGNYLVPLQIGAGEMAFPRLNVLSYWLYLAGGLVMVASFFVVLVTIVQCRAPGVTFGKLPFFIWSQLVTALLLLLAFPALQRSSRASTTGTRASPDG